MALAGKQIILDLYNCNYNIINSPDELEALLKDILEINLINIQSFHRQSYKDRTDFSLAAFLDQGHITVHTMPDKGFAAIDIFSELPDSTLDRIVYKIKRGLHSEKSKITYLRRGDFGSLSDMKPIINKNTKPWRRVRNTSAKVWNIIVSRHNAGRSGFPD